MLLQYNYVHDRAGGLAQLNNPYWPQFVSTLSPPAPEELTNGTYRLPLTPVNFAESKPGTKYATVWYVAPVDQQLPRAAAVHPEQPAVALHRAGEQRDKDVPENPLCPDDKRDVQFTVNGQFQPSIRSGRSDRDLGPRQRERHRLHHGAVDGDGDGTSSQDRHRRPGRQSPLPAVHHPPFEGRHTAGHSAGEPLRDCRDHPCRRRTDPRDAAARRASERRAFRHPSTRRTARKIRRRCSAVGASCRRR